MEVKKPADIEDNRMSGLGNIITQADVKITKDQGEEADRGLDPFKETGLKRLIEKLIERTLE